MLALMQRPFITERIVSPAKDAGAIGNYMQNNGAGPIPHTIRLTILSGRAKPTKFFKGARKMAQLLAALAVCNSSPRGSNALYWLLQATVLTCTSTDR